MNTDLILDWIKLLYYRKMKPISIGAKLLLVTTLQRKQYAVVLRIESTRRVYRNFGAFPSARLNYCFGNKKKKIFSLLEENLSKFRKRRLPSCLFEVYFRHNSGNSVLAKSTSKSPEENVQIFANVLGRIPSPKKSLRKRFLLPSPLGH